MYKNFVLVFLFLRLFLKILNIFFGFNLVNDDNNLGLNSDKYYLKFIS